MGVAARQIRGAPTGHFPSGSRSRLQPESFLLRRLSLRKVWSGDDSVSAAASDVTPCVRHVLRHEQRVVGGDVDGGGVISKFFCGGHLAAGPVLKDEHIRGAVDGRDGV